jgi:hypothetical protein
MTETTVEQALRLYDPLVPGLADDPYLRYARVREIAPVLHHPHRSSAGASYRWLSWSSGP